MNTFRFMITTFLPLFLSLSVFAQQSGLPADFVDPFIGTGGHGHTFPGATVPFGMVQLSPDTRLDGWDGCSGYHHSDEYIYGFSHTHLSGTGVPDYCDILFMPFTGEVRINNGSDGEPGYRSHFSHSRESAEPGYYRVFLEEYGIEAELTTTTRAGFHRYLFPEGNQPSVLIDLKHRDQVTDSWIRLTGESEVEGFRGSTGWARDQRVYFVARFSKPIQSSGMAINDSLVKQSNHASGKNLKAWFKFDKTGNNQLLVKVGISAISAENARMNLEKEIPDWDFDQVKKSSEMSWNHELGKIEVKGDKDDMKTIFYTALYHSMISPNTYNDADGTYLGRDFKVHNSGNDANYTVFSLWDTYRALHPLLTIIDQKRTNGFIKTFINQYQQGGMLPVWELSANETWCMIGYHSVPVIADAWMKGIRDYDGELALEAMVNSASRDIFGLEYYKKFGFIPAELESESVSKTLEYAYDDWCIARMAESLGHDSLSKAFFRRAQSYRHLFDPVTGYMRARFNGGWFNPFDPAEVNFNYTEANSWQYSFGVPHDLDGFIKMHGGKEKAALFLDNLFSVSSVTTGREQSDITGLIGQYAHGNEPSHHIAYLYNYAGKPWKTQEKVSRIMKEFYTAFPDGLIGNEDCGQMSAWAVFSAMGFYPVCPGSEEYALGSPAFKETVIYLENGKLFRIKALNLSDTNIYIKQASLNHNRVNRSFLTHSEIMNGGELVLTMGPDPEKSFGTGPGNEPSTRIDGDVVLAAPVASPSGRIFRKELEVTLSSENGSTILYSIDGSEPGPESKKYHSPVRITETTTLKFKATKPGFITTGFQESTFTRMPEGLEMISLSEFASQYSGSGLNNMIDGLKGSSDFRLGGWQGFQGRDMEAVIHILDKRTVKSITIGCFQDVNSWIFMPSVVELWTSADGTVFKKAGEIPNDFPSDKWGAFINDYAFKNLNIEERYIKLKLINSGVCPPWHPGQGNPTWIFADEISFGF
ncbi:MAG: GH92 family glycosyl hydrolase [Bacteroidota bacterium]